MESRGKLTQSIEGASKHYSSMFSLPSLRKALLAVAATCVVVGLAVFSVSPSRGIVTGLVLGISLFLLTLMADLTVSKGVLRNDPIYQLRRTLALSLIGWFIWLLFIAIGVALNYPFGSMIWVKLCLIGYAAVVTLRAVVFFATSSAETWRKFISALLNPVLCMAAFLVFWTGMSDVDLIQAELFAVISLIVACVAAYVFLSSLDRLGKKTYSMSLLPLFRAFMLNWVAGLNTPLEEQLEKTGENADIEVILLKFDAEKPKAAVIVPFVHPGPFKNVGSSLLPSLLKHEFQKEFNCEACVPLGILGHELDLASQTQNYKIISQVIAMAKFKATADYASPYVRVIEGSATASSQIFGDTVFLSFTLSPKTTEDLPQELGRMVSEEAEKYGLKTALVVNTHNSITDVVDTEQHLDVLQAAASRCLQEVVAQQTSHFMVGAASVYPTEFTLKDGIGAGGITVLVVQVEKQKTAYVVIDGNNMVSGLREKILAALSSAGFDEGEVFTTDTHAVSAIATGRRAGSRGYHPVGEAIDHETLIRRICEAAKKAEANLEPSRAGCIRFVVPQVRVIGEARLQAMTTLVDKSIHRAKELVVPVFGLEGLILVLLLLL